MSLMEEVLIVRERVVARLRELEPLVREYEELKLAAAEMGIDVNKNFAESPRGGPAKPAARRPRGRARSGQRRATRAAARSPEPPAQDLGDRVLQAVSADPGKTVAEYARALDLAPTAIYRPVRELATSGAIVKRARQLYPS
jgi:hypothetical protein